MDEASVLESIRSGDIDAFAEIVEYYQLPITRYLHRLTGNREIAEDLAQETFIQAYRSIPETRFNHSFKSWLYRVATNTSNRFFRKAGRHRTTSMETITGYEPSLANDETDTIIQDIHVRETLSQMKKEQSISLLLHFWEGLTYREIADICGVSEEAVRKRVNRGCREFRKRYQLSTG